MPGALGNKNAAKNGPRLDRQAWQLVRDLRMRRLPSPVEIARQRVRDAEQHVREHPSDLAYRAALGARWGELCLAEQIAARKSANG